MSVYPTSRAADRGTPPTVGAGGALPASDAPAAGPARGPRKTADEALRESRAQMAADLADLKLLQDISAELIGESDVQLFYERIVDAAVAIMRSDFASMQMLYPKRGPHGSLRLLACRGFSAEAARHWEWVSADSACTCGLALRTRQPRFMATDVRTCEAMAGTAEREALLGAGILSAQSTALVSRGGELLGMITTHWNRPHEPTERDLRLMDILARQAADLIERKRAEGALRQSEERARLLSEALAQLLARADPDAVVRELFPRVAGHLDVDTYFNYMVNEAGDALYLHASAGISAETAHEIRRLEFGQAICGTVAQTREAIVATDIQNSTYDKAALVRSMGIQAYACNPLMAGDRLIGTLSFASRTRRGFDEGELEFMRQIARYVAVAMDRARTTARLRESEERFRVFASATSEVVYRMSPDWREMRHLEGREFIADTLEPSRTWLDRYIHPDDQALVTGAIRRAIETRGIFELEHRVIRVDGTLGWTHSRAIPILDGQGEVVEWFGAASDITTRKQAEEALRRRESLLAGQRAALELAVNDAPLHRTLVKLVELVTEQLGQGARAAFYLANDEGTTLHHVVGMCDEYARTVDGFPIGADSLACGLATHTGKPLYTSDVRTEPTWARWLWMAEKFDYRACWSVPIHSTRGAFVGTLAVYSRHPREATARDVELCSLVTHTASVIVSRHRESEARTRAEDALRESEERFRMLADNMSQLAWTCDQLGSINWYNRRWLEYTGQGFEESKGWGWTRRLHPEHVERVVSGVTRARELGEVWEDTFPLRGADGRYRWFLSRAYPIRGDRGEILRWFGTNTDITAQRDAEEELRRHRDRLQELVEERTREILAAQERLRLSERMASLGTLSAGLGHDMGNLLVPVRVRLETLGAMGLPEEASRELAGIRSCLEYLQKLAGGLRQLAADPARSAPAEPAELRAWWSEAATVLKNALPRGVQLGSAPPEEECWVAMSKAALTQVVFNLVQNAGDALRERGSGTVTIGMECRAGAVVVTVSDDGPGMSEDVRRRCMEPFFTTKTRGVSTGLGLALVYGLVQAAGGTITVESRPGRGTTFTIRLARVAAPAGAPGPRGRALVDVRDARWRAIVTAELESLSYEVGCGAGGWDGADLVVTDRAELSGEAPAKLVVLAEAPKAPASALVLGGRPRIQAIRGALREAAAAGRAGVIAS